MHQQMDGSLLVRVRMAPWCGPCASVSPPWVTAMWMMHKKPCCDYIHMEKPWRWQQRISIVRLYSTIVEKSWIFSQKFLRHIIVTKTPGWFPFPQGGRSMIKLNASLWKMVTMVLMTNIMNSWCRYYHTFLCILMQAGGHHGKCNRKLRKAAGRPVSGSPTSKCHRKGVSLLQSGRSWQGCMHMNPCQAILKHVCVWRQRAK